MEILECAEGADQKKELARCRKRLQELVEDPLMILMVVRGDNASQIAEFGKERSEMFPDRNVVWLKDIEILKVPGLAHLFGGRPDDVAAVFIDLDNEPVAWLDLTASKVQVDRAFRKAGRS